MRARGGALRCASCGAVERAERIETTMLAMLDERAPSTACPSDVARALGGTRWRPLMQPVRDVAAALQDRGVIDVTQRGMPVMLREARGPIRLRLKSHR